MKNIAHRAVIKNHDLTQIRFYLRQILYVRAIAECAVLAIVSAAEIFAFALNPIDDRISVFLYRCSEYYQIIPFADLMMTESVDESRGCRRVKSHLAQKVMTVWALVHVVQYGYLGTEHHTIASDGTLKLDFDHVSSTHSPTLSHAVDQSLVQVDNKSLLGWIRIICHDIGGLTPGYERSRRSRGARVSELRSSRV